jgi:predicted phage terminase large subunit-like protein
MDEATWIIEDVGKLDFKSFWQSVERLSTPEAIEHALYIRCATDLRLFARIYFPHYCRIPFNDFHEDLFLSWKYGERKVRRLRGAPRGYAKSTFVSLIKPIHDICYGLEKFIVLLSNTKSQATGKLKDIRNELLTNDRLVRDYNIVFAKSVPAETNFIVGSLNGQVALSAYGAGAEIRGIRFNQHRPTKVICDDVEHSEEVFNEEIRNKYESWFLEVISKMGDEKTNIEFVGTVLHPKSLLKKVEANPSYESKVYKAVISWADNQELWNMWRKIYTDLDNQDRVADSDAFFEANKEKMLQGTKVLWPDKEPYVDLMKELVESGRRAFMKEKQNSPLGADDTVFEELQYYRESDKGIIIERSGAFIPWEHLQGRCIGVLDPSTGQVRAKRGKLGDYTCILVCYMDPRGRLLVHLDWTKRFAPTKYISEIFELHDKYHFEKFGVETNLYRNLLVPNIIAERKRREELSGKSVKIPFYDIDNIENKEKRIYTLEPKVSHGWILFNRGLSQEFISQVLEFPHADHDDCPDALEMAWGLMNNRYQPSPLSVEAMAERS